VFRRIAEQAFRRPFAFGVDPVLLLLEPSSGFILADGSKSGKFPPSVVLLVENSLAIFGGLYAFSPCVHVAIRPTTSLQKDAQGYFQG